MKDVENEIMKQVKLFSKGESYLYVKQDLQDNYDEITASKIAQEAYKRFKLKKIKGKIKLGFLMFTFAQIAIFIFKDENSRFSYFLHTISGGIMVCFGLWEIYNYRKTHTRT